MAVQFFLAAILGVFVSFRKALWGLFRRVFGTRGAPKP